MASDLLIFLRINWPQYVKSTAKFGWGACAPPVASTRVQGWGDEPCEPTVRLPDWNELVASYSRMKSAWGWANGGQPILVCYIRKYVIILGDIPVDIPPTKYWGDVSPAGLTPVPPLGPSVEPPLTEVIRVCCNVFWYQLSHLPSCYHDSRISLIFTEINSKGLWMASNMLHKCTVQYSHNNSADKTTADCSWIVIW